MANTFQKVSPGAPLDIPAATWNALLEAARRFTDEKLGVAKKLPLESGPLTPAVRVLVSNDSGGALDEFSVVAVSAPPILPTDDPFGVQARPLFSGTIPAAASDTIAILQQPLAVGEIGRACIHGVAVVSVDITDVTHTWANPVTAHSDYLASGATGTARVLWYESQETSPTTGVQLGLVLLVQGGTGTSPPPPPPPPPAPITTGNVGPAASGSTVDESTGTLKAANETGAKIQTLTSGVRVLEILEAYLSQWGAVTDNDQRFTGDKRVVDATPEGEKAWIVGTMGDTKGSIFPGGYTVVVGGSQLLGPASEDVPAGNTYAWANNHSTGVVFVVNLEDEGAIAGSAASYKFVPRKGTTGELYSGDVTTATAGDKVATVVTGAGLVQISAADVSGPAYAGYYPAYHLYIGQGSLGTCSVWIGADVTSTHFRRGMNRGKPADRADGLLDWHFRDNDWDDADEGDMLIARLHVGLDDEANYPGTPRKEVFDEEAESSADGPASTGLRYWVKRGDFFWPGMDYSLQYTPKDDPYAYTAEFRGGELLQIRKIEAPVPFAGNKGLNDAPFSTIDTWYDVGSSVTLPAGTYHLTGSFDSSVQSDNTSTAGQFGRMEVQWYNVTTSTFLGDLMPVCFLRQQVSSVAENSTEGYYGSANSVEALAANDELILKARITGTIALGGGSIAGRWSYHRI